MSSTEQPTKRVRARASDLFSKGSLSGGSWASGFGRWSAILVVSAIWALCVAAPNLIVLRHGVALPWSDDWAMVPAISRAEPVTFKWLWTQHNEHRILIPKLFYVATVRLARGDYRWQVPANIALLAVVTAFLLAAVRRVRGRLSLLDAFIPLILLNFGQGAMSWGFHFQFTSVTVLACALLSILLWQGNNFSGWGVFLAGIFLLILPLCGGSGLFYALILGPWFSLRGFLQMRGMFSQTSNRHVSADGSSSLAKRHGFLLGVFPAASLILCAAYFIHYTKPQLHISSALPLAIQTSSRILSSSFGLRESPFYPTLVFATGVLFLGTLAWSGWRGLTLKSDWTLRVRFLDLAVFSVTVFVLLFAVGYGRGEIWRDGMEAHYTTLSSPALVAVYLILSFGVPAFVGLPVQSGLLLLIAVLNCGYIRSLYHTTLQRQAYTVELRRDLSAGMPAAEVTERYITKLFYVDTPFYRSQITNGVRDFRNNGFSLYGPPEVADPLIAK